jgi:hypothetical protein
MANSRRGWRLLALILILSVFFATRRGSKRLASDGDSAAVPASTKYVPDSTEGLGASVAILVDNSGSMRERVKGDPRPKFEVAREALQAMLASTDSFVARNPGFPVKVGLYQFASDVTPLVPVKAYNRTELLAALESMSRPDGGTAIGDAMDAARADLYRAGTIRKYILVVTDGENTDGRSPARVAREINERSEGAVRMYFVAFDIAASRFNFVSEVRGEVLEARDGLALRASLDSLYRGKILAESMDAGETLADTSGRAAPADTSRAPRPPTSPRKPTP